MPKNTTQIPNEYLETKARLRLSGTEHQVLFVIERETFGFHREKAEISLNYFSQKTGMKKNQICNVISRLKNRKIIHQSVNTFSISIHKSVNDYSLNSEYRFTKQCKPIHKSVNGTPSEAYSPKPPQKSKETIKETIKETVNKPTRAKEEKKLVEVPEEFLSLVPIVEKFKTLRQQKELSAPRLLAYLKGLTEEGIEIDRLDLREEFNRMYGWAYSHVGWKLNSASLRNWLTKSLERQEQQPPKPQLPREEPWVNVF